MKKLLLLALLLLSGSAFASDRHSSNRFSERGLNSSVVISNRGFSVFIGSPVYHRPAPVVYHEKRVRYIEVEPSHRHYHYDHRGYNRYQNDNRQGYSERNRKDHRR